MKRKTFINLAIVFFAIGMMMAGCNTASVNKKQLAGTMEEPVPSDTMPTVSASGNWRRWMLTM